MRETATFKTFNSSHRGIAPIPYQRRTPKILFPDNLDVTFETQSMGDNKTAKSMKAATDQTALTRTSICILQGSQRKVIVHFEQFQSPPLLAARLIIPANSKEA